MLRTNEVTPMTAGQPAEALRGAQVEKTCDRCNREIRTGDAVRYYAMASENGEWIVHRLWCGDCGEETVNHPKSGLDELVGEAMFITHQLTAIRILDRSEPAEKDQHEHPNRS